MATTHKLAAIMFTDIVGYTALMGESEIQAYELLKKNRLVQKPLIEMYEGKWLKEMGDGVLASFPTISDTVYCAIDIQRACQKEAGLKLRIGIHLGEVITEDGDVFGDGVNIASRLESLAPAGGIYVSESVYGNIENKEGIKVEYVSEEHLKNVKHPIKIYEIDIAKSTIPDRPNRPEKNINQVEPTKKSWLKYLMAGVIITILVIAAFILSEKNVFNKPIDDTSELTITDNSIAVLPFYDLSENKDQEYICVGMMEVIQSDLSKIKDLRLTSTGTMRTYEGTDKTIPEIAREVAVRYVLEGSVQPIGDNVRITTKLIEAETDYLVWGEYYESDLSDLFHIQSDVAKQIAEQLQINLSHRTEDNISGIPTQDSKAYNLYLKSLELAWSGNPSKWKEVLDQVVSIDSTFAPGYAELGRYWIFQSFNNRNNIQIAEAYLNKAILLDPDIPRAHTYLNWLNLWLKWDFYTAEREGYYAQKIEPSNHVNYNSDLYLSMGRYSKALEYSLISIIAEPNTGHVLAQHAMILYFNNRHEEARKMLERTLKANREIQPGNFYWKTAKTYLYLGEYDEVIKLLENVQSEYQTSPYILSLFCIAHNKLNHHREASELLSLLINLYGTERSKSPAFFIAMVYAQMNDIDRAFEWLEKSYQDHEVEMYWLKVEPPFEPLHSDPRWQVMLDKIGYPKIENE